MKILRQAASLRPLHFFIAPNVMGDSLIFWVFVANNASYAPQFPVHEGIFSSPFLFVGWLSLVLGQWDWERRGNRGVGVARHLEHPGERPSNQL
jgi:hypothetical protein